MAAEHTATTVNFDREKALAELSDLGYTVIPGIFTAEDCDEHIQRYKDWLKQFGDDDWPFGCESLIQNYRIGHFENTWDVRLKSKPVFASIWETEKLLTSVDAVAIGEPPEADGGNRMFAKAGRNWFHLDQGVKRKGLHAYQGGIYLEEATDMDYCFRVLDKSHKFHEEFFQEFPQAAKVTKSVEFYKLLGKEQDWYKSKGCTEVKVPVPKGGVVLWDSRTVHDNCRPEPERPNKDRWRFVVFVCMAPAWWARQKELAKKRHAYKNILMTTHWPCQEVSYFPDSTPPLLEGGRVHTVDKLPENAQSPEARLLMGMDEYDFEDDEPNGPDWMPEWI